MIGAFCSPLPGAGTVFHRSLFASDTLLLAVLHDFRADGWHRRSTEDPLPSPATFISVGSIRWAHCTFAWTSVHAEIGIVACRYWCMNIWQLCAHVATEWACGMYGSTSANGDVDGMLSHASERRSLKLGSCGGAQHPVLVRQPFDDRAGLLECSASCALYDLRSL
jgi:hypothetical protein